MKNGITKLPIFSFLSSSSFSAICFSVVHPFLARFLELPETCEEPFAAYFTLFLESFEADLLEPERVSVTEPEITLLPVLSSPAESLGTVAASSFFF